MIHTELFEFSFVVLPSISWLSCIKQKYFASPFCNHNNATSQRDTSWSTAGSTQSQTTGSPSLFWLKIPSRKKLLWQKYYFLKRKTLYVTKVVWKNNKNCHNEIQVKSLMLLHILMQRNKLVLKSYMGWIRSHIWFTACWKCCKMIGNDNTRRNFEIDLLCIGSDNSTSKLKC